MNALSLDDDIVWDDEDEFEEDGHFRQAAEEPVESEVLRREAFRDILNQVSSSLLVLSVYWNSKIEVTLKELLVPLPRLEELHINRRCVHLRSQLQETPPLFSNLRHLHIAGRCGGFTDFLVQIAPRLTHLYVPIYCVRSAIVLSWTLYSYVNPPYPAGP
jgi:hypothetical protein